MLFLFGLGISFVCFIVSLIIAKEIFRIDDICKLLKEIKENQ